MRDAIAYVQSGKIGTVDLAIGLCYKPRGSIGKVTKPTEPPATMDYDLWCGPAPKTPVMRSKLHYDWHWIWNYGCGDLGNQGVHEMDKARWGLGQSTMPNAAMSLGGRFGYVDDGETANTQLSVFDYDKAQLIFEVRGLETKDYKGAKVGNIWVGCEGYVVCPSYSSGVAYDKDGKKLADVQGRQRPGPLQQLREGGPQPQVRGAERRQSAKATSRLPSAISPTSATDWGTKRRSAKRIPSRDNKTVNDFFAAMLEHLKANKVDVSEAIGRYGAVLTIDPKTETIAGVLSPDSTKVSKANTMLFREYRKGFELKEVV